MRGKVDGFSARRDSGNINETQIGHVVYKM
jgi:hypothetical protein